MFQFIRCYSGRSNVSEILSDLLVKDVGAKPDLLISCFGGAEYFNMTDKLEKEFMNGISQVAGTKGTFYFEIRRKKIRYCRSYRRMVVDDRLERRCIETHRTKCSSLHIAEQKANQTNYYWFN